MSKHELGTWEELFEAEEKARKRAEDADDRIDVLEDAIRAHRDQKGHDRCRLDDATLYAVLPEGAANADTTLPPKEEFVAGCAAYWEARNGGVSHDHCSLVNVMAERDRFAHQVIELGLKITRLKEQVRGEQRRAEYAERALMARLP